MMKPISFFLWFLACLNLSTKAGDNVISITGGTAKKPSTAAAFTFTRTSVSGDYQELIVSYTIDPSTTAVLNLDYTSSLTNSGSVDFQLGEQSVEVTVTPKDNPNQTGPRYITVDLADKPVYQIGTGTATVDILDDKPAKRAVTINAVIVGGSADPWTTVDASMVDSMTVTGGVQAIGSFTLARTGPNPDPLLTINPDLGFLSGTRIAPITPNVFDVRITSSNEGLSP
jgi:hypothetical protein